MNIFELLTSVSRLGIALIVAVHTSKNSADELSMRFGSPPKVIRDWQRLGKFLFSPTTPKKTASEAEREEYRADLERLIKIRDIAQRDELSVDKLCTIFKYVKQLRTDVTTTRTQLFLELVTQAKRLSWTELNAQAKDRTRQLNKSSSFHPTTRANLSAVDGEGNRYLTARFVEKQFSDIAEYINVQVKAQQTHRSGRTDSHIRGDVILKMLREGMTPLPEATPNKCNCTNICTCSDNNTLRQKGLEPCAIMFASELFNGTERKAFSLTDGRTIYERIDDKLSNHGWAVVYDDLTLQPEVAVRIERRWFNTKHIAMASAHQILCAHPDCTEQARFGQGHHIVDFSQGGATTIENLAMLCPRHHRECTTKRARIQRNNQGELEWVYFSSGKARVNHMPVRRLSAGELVKLYADSIAHPVYAAA
ncbi:Endonuclease [Corynebacterium kutscheri]|uniref:Endonuclease n=1 Tax=Corynebacterium kutscheri TaxID=35755 RepID=A0A0F6QY83_9CORY|nr:HNH endonuclease signature motif containing protein [Corynebacterium kutscheri]AKE40412.1 HNH endonuclease [Corynebacterium kutscheri]VEH05255.1 Endonuclease [Corynebacterium kutscheri]VEH10807.1 Endonuclease [Corynebacterium kutscheri]VEH80714.1 Endonuclease [Corynebacterium kutscheri]